MAKKRRRTKSRVPPEPWEIRYFRRQPTDDPDQRVPGLDFLDSCPMAVQADLLATLIAVRDAPPPSFAGGARWQAMHGQMKGYFEVRIMGPGKFLYRLFCMLERDPDISGLGAPSVVVIQGCPSRTAARSPMPSTKRCVRSAANSGEERLAR
jgi:hypothetical protein